MPSRFSRAGTPLGSDAEPFVGILEGIQCDQDYLRLLFNLERGPNRQLVCHYCDALNWVSNRVEIGPHNTPESLYTVFGPREGGTQTLDPAELSIFCSVLKFIV